MSEDVRSGGDRTKQIEPGTPVGKCPNCGGVYGEEVHIEFPTEAACNRCGAELEKAGLADKPVEVPVR